MALSSNTDIAGVSSINIGASTKLLSWISSCSHSYFLRLPLRILSAGRPVSLTIILLTSWILDISSEKNAIALRRVILKLKQRCLDLQPPTKEVRLSILSPIIAIVSNESAGFDAVNARD